MSNYEIKNPMIGGVIAAKVPKEELPLPHLHFIAATDWIDKLGEKAFCGYLKLFTMAYQDEKTLKHDSAKISSSLDFARKEMNLGSKATFYNKVLIPLWNYGLIDLVESGEVKSNVQKPLNIIVYPYPNMEFKRMVMPLDKIRNYDTDYNSEARINANKISKMKAGNVDLDTVQKLNGNEIYGSKIELEENEVNSSLVQKLNGNESLVQKLNGNERYSSKIEHVIKDLKEEEVKKEEEEEEEGSANYLSDSKYLNLKDKAISVGYTEEESIQLVNLIHERGIIDNLTDSLIMKSFEMVAQDLEKGIVKYDLVKWTAGKLERNVSKGKIRVLKIPASGKNNRPANKKGSRKAPSRRIEPIPNWIDKPKEDQPKAANQDPELAERMKKLQKELTGK